MLSAATMPAVASDTATATTGKMSTFFMHFLSRRIRAHTPYYHAQTQANEKGLAQGVRISVELRRQKHAAKARFTACEAPPRLNQYAMNRAFYRIPKFAVFLSWIFLQFAGNTCAQTPAEKPKEKPTASSEEKPVEQANAAQIEILETKYRFEMNGDSRKEVHALVKINSELGVRQFARLNFDYNRSFQSVEIPLAHITHANGGTSDILPSAITDAPNPAVEKFPAYHDVRVKSVRILGLQPGDSLEYRVVTTTTKPPLAPEFWLEHSFKRTGIVSREVFQIDLPAQRARVQINQETPSKVDKSGEGESARESYHWDIMPSALKPLAVDGNEADITLTSFPSWSRVQKSLFHMEDWHFATSIYSEAEAISGSTEGRASPKFLYNFVSRRVATVDLPFAQENFVRRDVHQILNSGYGTPEEKVRLLFALMTQIVKTLKPLGYSDDANWETALPRPTLLSGFLAYLRIGDKDFFLDPGREVAPFGMVPAKLRGQRVLGPCGEGEKDCFVTIPKTLPFPASQSVTTHSELTSLGVLKSKVAYLLRGDSELLLRVAFHQAPAEKQKEIAQYLALSDGFRGKVTSVKTSDPYDTDKPFEVEYELTQEKFVDWSKKPVVIPALLPLPGLPEMPKKSAGDSKIELGTPLDIELSGTLRLPPGVTARAPVGTSAKRDYATFTSQYSAKENVLQFSRHLNFLLSEIPGSRAVDLGAFLHAVQTDQSQLFVLDKLNSPPPTKPK